MGVRDGNDGQHGGFRTMMRRFPGWIVVLVLLGPGLSTAHGQGDGEPAMGSPEWDDPDAPVDERFEHARRLHVEGRFEEAFALYDAILADRGPDAPTLTTYGNMKWKIGAMKEAEDLFLRAIASMPKHIKARQFLGQLYFHQGRRKQARAVFEAMLKLPWLRDNVEHSARLNIARIDLLNGKWLDARKGFVFIRKEGNKAYRKSGERGLRMIRDMLALEEWPRYDSRRLYLHFSPHLRQFEGSAAKKAFAEPLDAFLEMAVEKLGMPMPEPWHLYIFEDDGECSVKTGRKTAHGWDYSWWLSYTALDSDYGPKHAIAHQLAARWGGSRPISVLMVEGFCAYMAGDFKKPHANAAALYEAGHLPSIETLQRFQRKFDQFGIGASFVRYLIDTYGFEKFHEMWRWFNVVVNAPQHKQGRSREIHWDSALDELFRKAFGVGFADVERDWRRSLSRG